MQLNVPAEVNRTRQSDPFHCNREQNIPSSLVWASKEICADPLLPEKTTEIDFTSVGTLQKSLQIPWLRYCPVPQWKDIRTHPYTHSQ